jgi:hypothetical protein
MDESKAIDVVLKSMDVQQSIITLIFAGIGYVLVKDAQGITTKRSLRSSIYISLLPVCALGILLYGHWGLLASLEEQKVPAFVSRWSFPWEPALDLLIIFSATALGWRLFR